MQPRARSRSGWLTTLTQAAVGGLVLLAPSTPALLPVSSLLGLALLADAIARTGHALQASLCGLTFGAAANAVALEALVGLLARFAGLPQLACWTIAAVAWVAQALPYAIGAGLARAARAHEVWLALPLAIVPALALTPQLFPWHVAATLSAWVPLIQLAELGGEPLLGAALLLAAGALAALVRARTGARRRPATALLLVISVPLTYGLARLPAVAEARAHAPALRIGVVQGNVGVDRKHDEREAAAQLRALQHLTRALEQQRVALTLWGETAYPYPLPRSATRAPADARAPLAEGVRGPVLLGVETYAGFDADAAKYNSAWLVRPDGSLGERVDKARLLAFGEFVPLWHVVPALRARFPRGFSAGAPGIVRVAGSALGVLVCYEDLFAESARATVDEGARALVNLTNDAWFGDSRMPRLHELTTRLRAVETRRDLVRAVNTGVSSFTSASGASLVRTRVFEVAHFVAEVRLLDLRTPYARFGDWVTPCCVGGLLAMLCVRRRRSSRAQP